MKSAKRLLTALPREDRDRLLALAREVSFPQDARIFEEGNTADRFWVIRSGSVTLDLKVPGRGKVPVEPLGPGDLLGWSWLFPPYRWDFGAEAASPVRADEFDAAPVRRLYESDPKLGVVLLRVIAEILAGRLGTARGKLIEQYEIHRSPTV
ncbi:cyclic nucleotide-binding domain-containing protein [Streptomyces sp. NPDC058045]|uniref:cyclic nucleotide-binding domain-containing protein n=1 Tax=Streptomyces sp. NPDC058045 TaxID=3346311 RepID=UPI0036EBB9CA